MSQISRLALICGLTCWLLGFMSGCSLSPVSAAAEIAIQGVIQADDGSAYFDLPVSLYRDSERLQSTRTNAAGVYRFSIKGEQSQFFGAAADLKVSASTASGSVAQSFKVLKTSLQLPEMRIWNGHLEGPTKTEGNKGLFRWQTPISAVRGYQVSLNDSQAQIWKKPASSNQLEVPLAVLEPQKTYSCRITALLSDYEASFSSSLQSPQQSLKTLPIRQLQDSQSRKNLGSLQNGRFVPAGRAELNFVEGQTLELEVLLDQPALIQGLHWIGTGFEAEITIRTSPSGSPLARKMLEDYLYAEWPAVQSDRLYLQLKPNGNGFYSLSGLRILG